MRQPERHSNGWHWTPPDKEWLEREYVELEKTLTQIAQEAGTSEKTVIGWVRRAKLEVRPRGTVPITPPSRAWLEEQYVGLGKTAQYIADELGISQPTVTKWLKQMNIRSLWGVRGITRGAHAKRGHKVLEEANIPYKCASCSRGPKKIWIELHHLDGNWTNNDFSNLQYLCRSCHSIAHDREKNFGKRIKTTKLTEEEVYKIREMYAGGSWTQQEIADIFDVHNTTISRIIRRKSR